MVWQKQVVQDVLARVPAGAVVEVVGSVRDGLLDGWSDLDLHLRLPHLVDLADLVPGQVVWAAQESESAEGQVLRVVWVDGRRVDFLVEAGRLSLPARGRDNDVRFMAALAVTRLGRGDQLIGLHLVLELLKACLVQAMLLRDRDEGTSVHRLGTVRDNVASEVARVARLPLDVTSRPNIVEQAVDLYGQWRQQLEADYQPDWSGLTAVLSRGYRACTPDKQSG